METAATRREYFDDTRKLQSTSLMLSLFKGEDGRLAMVLDSTIFHPQGGGQPADTGYISDDTSGLKFLVEDVRSKDGGVILHYGFFENSEGGWDSKIEKGQKVSLCVDSERRELNSRLHSAGHLLDICLPHIGLSHLIAGKGHHFPDGPFVEYVGTIPQAELIGKQKELEIKANAFISAGTKVSASVVPYVAAAELCGGSLPSYISKGSTPRIVKLGDHPGCPCGGTHVDDVSDIRGLKVTTIRVKKGITRVSYTVVP